MSRGGGNNRGGRGRGGSNGGERGRGSGSPFRGGRGGGRGGARNADFSGVAMDYNDLTADTFGFTPSPVFSATLPRNQRPPPGVPLQSQPSANSPSHSPNQSGYNTPYAPRGGRGGGRGGSFTPRGGGSSSGYDSPRGRGGGRGGRGGRGRGDFSGANTPSYAARGGAAGGLGFHAAPRGGGAGGFSAFGVRGGRGGGAAGGGRTYGYGDAVPGMASYGQPSSNKLLVPVRFVPATNAAYGLTGNAHEQNEPGELADQVHEGHLAEVLDKEQDEEEEENDDAENSREVERALLGLDKLEISSSAAPPHQATVTVESEMTVEATPEAITDEKDEVVIAEEQSATPPLLEAEPDVVPEEEEEEEPSFFIDTTPAPVQLDTAAAHPAPSYSTKGQGRPLGSSSVQKPDVPLAQPRVVSISDDIFALPSNLPKPPPASALPPLTRSASNTPNKTAPFEGEEGGDDDVEVAAVPKKLTSNQKRALKTQGKTARKAGKEHARSGNKHLGFNHYSSDEDADGQGAAMLDTLLGPSGGGGGGAHGMDEDLDDDEEEAPRQGDSDLEWGDEGPPLLQRGGLGSKNAPGSGMSLPAGRAKRAMRKEERQQTKEREKLERLAANARRAIVAQLGDAAAQDYESNARLGEDSDDDEDDEDQLRTAQSFVNGLLGPEAGARKTLAELALDARAQMEADLGEEGWRTTDGESETDESEDELDSGDMAEMDHSLAVADAEVDAIMAAEEDAMIPSDGGDFDSSIDSDEEDAAIQQALLAGGKIRLSSMGVGGPGGRRDAKARKTAKKGKGKARQPSTSEEEDDDDGDLYLDSDEIEEEMFNGKSSWNNKADDDDDYIKGLNDILDKNAHILDARDRKQRKKLFTAIENGDFRGVDFDDDWEIPTKAKKSGRKSKAGPPHSLGGTDFADELAMQWEQDRKKKGAYKQARALARAEAAEMATAQKHAGGKQRKGERTVDIDAFNGPESDVSIINAQIRNFLLNDLTSFTLALPPMSKKSRVAVHLLAEVYNLKSKSMGKGKARFPVLERTTKSSAHGVNERKIAAILGTAQGERSGGGFMGGPGGGKPTGKSIGLWHALAGGQKGGKGGSGGGAGGAKHSEGAVVGQGADRIGETNIGFALLKRMGWTEGTQMGMSGGISEPIAARIKNSKGGLGSGAFSVTRHEAVKLAVADDQW